MAEKEANAEQTSTIHLGGSRDSAPRIHGKVDENLALLSDEDREIVGRLSSRDAMLITHRGPSKGARYLLSGASPVTSIGRAPESDVFLDDVTVSRKHAVIERRESRSVLSDLGSLNGTYINGEATSEVILTSGDEIQIGKFHMLFFGGNK